MSSSRIYKWPVIEFRHTMAAEISCHVCGWEGQRDELNQPPGGEELYYCPECATAIDVE